MTGSKTGGIDARMCATAARTFAIAVKTFVIIAKTCVIGARTVVTRCMMADDATVSKIVVIDART